MLQDTADHYVRRPLTMPEPPNLRKAAEGLTIVDDNFLPPYEEMILHWYTYRESSPRKLWDIAAKSTVRFIEVSIRVVAG